MRISKDRVVSIDYAIRLEDGRIVESSASSGALTYLHGRAEIVPGVEQAIEGAENGAVLEVIVPPSEAFGDRDPQGIIAVPRAAFPPSESLDVGATYSALRADGHTILFRVVEAHSDTILIDTNHPLAGKTLYVWVVVREVREATDEEKRYGIAGRVVAAPPPA